MIVFLDIETTKHIPIPDDSFMADWIKKKNERARTKFFSPYLDKFTAVPSLMGIQSYDERGSNKLSIPVIIDNQIRIAKEFSDIVHRQNTIVTFNGNNFDLPILVLDCVRQDIKFAYGIISDILRERYQYSYDMMKRLAPYKDDIRPMRWFAESLGIHINKEKANIFEGLNEGKEIPLPDLKEKLLDDLRILRELYFKIMGIKPIEVSE